MMSCKGSEPEVFGVAHAISVASCVYVASLWTVSFDSVEDLRVVGLSGAGRGLVSRLWLCERGLG